MTTQNDYESEIDKNKLILKGMNKAIDILKIPQWSEALQEAYDKGYEKGVADARREVVRRIEAMPNKDVRPEITVWLEPKEYCLGYNKALNDVLATFRKEEV